jgi:hypothetical protein
MRSQAHSLGVTAHFGAFQPNVDFVSQGFELCEYVGNRNGTLSLVNLSIATSGFIAR